MQNIVGMINGTSSVTLAVERNGGLYETMGAFLQTFMTASRLTVEKFLCLNMIRKMMH